MDTWGQEKTAYLAKLEQHISSIPLSPWPWLLATECLGREEMGTSVNPVFWDSVEGDRSPLSIP